MPSNITWAELSKPYGHVHRDGRRHPAYGEDTIAAAVGAGTDPAGNRLDPAMPRYELATEDLRDLVAYLKRLDEIADPGVEAAAIRIGLLVPDGDAPEGAGIEGVMTRYVDRLNEAGGVYGRRIELLVSRAAGERTAILAAARRLLAEDGRVFALIAPLAGGIEGDMAALAEETGTPLLMPIAPGPRGAGRPGRFAFSLLPGLGVQLAVLERAVRDEVGQDLRLALIHGADLDPRTLDEELIESLAFTAAEEEAIDPDEAKRLAERLAAERVDAVLFLAAGPDLLHLAAAAIARERPLYILLPGAFLGPSVFQLPSAFEGRVLAALPMRLSDYLPSAQRAMAELMPAQRADGQLHPAPLFAYAMAALLVEGLRRAGRDLSRDAFVAALEGLNRFRTGVVPPLSYGPNRRAGVLGGYVVKIDLATGSLSKEGKWVDLEAAVP